MKTGLILEGGAMRGMYTAGVCDVFMEQGLSFDGCIGVSAGACFGCNVKSGQIGRTIRYNCRFSRDPRYAGFRSLFRTGDYFNAQFCYDEIPNKLDLFDYQAYRENPMPFYAVCTDADTGEALYRELPSCDAADMTYMRASASMPLFSRIVEIDGLHLSDGGTADSIPIRWFQSQGYLRNVVVLTRPMGYRKQPLSARGVMKCALHRYPALYEALKTRHIRYNETLDYLETAERAGDTLVIRPSRDLHISRIERDPEKLRALYALGRADAAAMIDAVCNFVNA